MSDALLGLTESQAKEQLKALKGVKRMSGKTLLNALSEQGLALSNGVVIKADQEVNPIAHSLAKLNVRHHTPDHLKVEVKDLPRPGDMYTYQHYLGHVVTGEVLGVYCYVELANPDGTFQTTPLSHMVLNGKPPPLPSPSPYLTSNASLKAERDRLLREVERLQEVLNDH
jgi:hypothetical protein